MWSYKKSVRAVLVTRPTTWGLRIAHYRRTSNAEASRWIWYMTPHDTPSAVQRYYTYPQGIYCCYILDCSSESCEVSCRQERALVNAFYIMSAPTHITHIGLLQAICNHKVNKLKWYSIFNVFKNILRDYACLSIL